jgi:hypothetical protein
MTPWSIASGLCVGDTNGLYYVKPDIARIELVVHFRETFQTTLLTLRSDSKPQLSRYDSGQKEP